MIAGSNPASPYNDKMKRVVHPVGNFIVWTTIPELDFFIKKGIILNYAIMKREGKFVKANVAWRY